MDGSQLPPLKTKDRCRLRDFGLRFSFGVELLFLAQLEYERITRDSNVNRFQLLFEKS
jgi:hypothetical protein